MKPYIHALAAIALWATLAALGTKLSSIPPFLLVGICLSLGSLCGLPWIKEWRVPLPTLLMGIYGLFGYHFFLFMALRNAPVVEANLINYLWPLLIVLLSPVFLPNASLNSKHLVAAGLGFAGAFLIVTGGRLAISSEGLWGYLFAAASAFIWASYSLLLKRVPAFSTGAVGLFCLVSGALSLLCHWALEASYRISSAETPLLFILGLGPMGLAFYFWDSSLKKGDPRTIGSLSYLTPLLSTSFLVLAGRGHFTWISGIAMLLIVSGAGIGALAGKR